MKQLLLFLLIFYFQFANAQVFRHYDYLGAGHTKEVTVTASHQSTSAEVSIDGFDIKNEDQLNDASRFLAQCTFGADMATIRMTAAMGYEAWLEEQFELPMVPSTVLMHRLKNIDPEGEGEDGEIFGSGYWTSAWFQSAIKSPDILRQRMAFILSQIMVINNRSDLFEDFGQASSYYYDLMLRNTFTNYRTLLQDVTYSASMGVFLSHYNNPKADPANNIHPDENYAREIMQLFSIGLWELNPDGTRKRDGNNQFIPTYDNNDIKEFAQVFTGLGSGAPGAQFGGLEDEFNAATFREPMKMFDSYHDKSEKVLLNGYVIPAGTSGSADLSLTLDHLSNHNNTAPFISKSLIRFLTTSNPYPGYVQRVASSFKPSEQGNFKEVIKAILLDPDARAKPNPNGYTFGKLREPLVRYMNFFKAIHLSAGENGEYPAEWECMDQSFGQVPLYAPSVFNYFLPEYSPPGVITQNYHEGPEFQILNSTNSIGFINEVDKLAVRQVYFASCIDEWFEEDPNLLDDAESLEEEIYGDYTELVRLASTPSDLVSHLNTLLGNGLLTADTRDIITQAITPLDQPIDRVRLALYLVMISPDYSILK